MSFGKIRVKGEKCEQCSKKEATHYYYNIQWHSHEVQIVCEDCANERIKKEWKRG